MPTLRDKISSAIRPASRRNSSKGVEDGLEVRPQSAAAAGAGNATTTYRGGSTSSLPFRRRSRTSSFAPVTAEAEFERSNWFLTKVPKELLGKIVAYCDADSILAARRTCRELKRVCDDPLVLEESLWWHMPTPDIVGTPSAKPLLERIRCQTKHAAEIDATCLPWQTWLSLAFAISQRHLHRTQFLAITRLLTTAPMDSGATNWMDPPLLKQLEDDLGVLATLLVLGYCEDSDATIGLHLMALNSWTSKHNLWSETRISDDKQLNLQLAFCMTAGILNSQSADEDRHMTPHAFQSLTSRVKAEFRGDRLSYANTVFGTTWEGLQTRSLQLAGIIGHVMQNQGYIDVPQLKRIPLLSASNTTSIPLLRPSDAGKGLATLSTSWQEWYNSHVRAMVSTLDEEEWYGYYIYGLEVSRQHDPAMESIRFKYVGNGQDTSSTAKHKSSTADVAATGTRQSASSTSVNVSQSLEAVHAKDGITRDFNFIGSVVKSTGMISLRKDYVGAHHWDYEGVVTPFGILGEWGKRDAGNFGYFWLWRRSWMDPGVEVDRHDYE